MALPIQETPILYGEDARRFAENIRTAESRPVPREDYERAKRSYERSMKKKQAEFVF